MTDIQTFNSPEFGSIRSVEQNGEPWFVGKDVAEALGYGNPQTLITPKGRETFRLMLPKMLATEAQRKPKKRK